MLLLFMVLPSSNYSSPIWATPTQKWTGLEKLGVDGKTSLRHIILCKARFFLGHLMKIHAVRELTLLTIQKPEFYVIRRTVSFVDRFGPVLVGPIFGPSTVQGLTSNSIWSFQESLSMFDHLDMIH